jgi:AcrR family transcriptional regulator
MPRPLDAAARRREVVAALRRVAARDGLAAATARGVAAEAGLSLGAVTRVAPTQEDLHVEALREVLGAVRGRLADGTRTGDPVVDAEAALAETLPLDPVSAAEAGVYYSYLERARSRPALRAVADEVDDALAGLARRVVDDVAPAGLDEDDRAGAARELHALTEGLALALVTWPHRRRPEEARAVVRAWLERLAGGRR